jgi:putative membrane protein
VSRTVVHPWQPAFEPEWALAIAVFAIDYVVVVRSFERRGRAVPRIRRIPFAAGLLVLAVALLSPIEHLALTSMLSFHLLQNVMIADWAPPLLLLGLTPAMIAAVERLPGLRRAVRPWLAFTVWVATWYVVHMPPIYDYALTHRAALGVEHVAFIVSGLVFWWPDLVGGYLSLRGRVVYLFLAMMAMMPLNIAIALAGHPLYSFYRDTPKLGNLSALADQRIAGATTLALETVILGVAALAAAIQLVREERRRSVYLDAVAG